jgi:hypothetical protein
LRKLCARRLAREQGYLKAHRAQQFCGLRGNADVVCPELPSAMVFDPRNGFQLDDNEIPVSH